MISPNLVRPYADAPTARTTHQSPVTAAPAASATFKDAIANATASGQGDKFTISEEGKAALHKSQSAYQDIVNHPDPEIRVQQYAIPDWLVDYAILITPDMIGKPYAETLMVGNNGKLLSADPTIKTEFYAGIRQHYLDVLEKNGLTSPADRYNALIADKSRSEEIHQQFKESIATDEKLLALMQSIGISIS